jgi:hypothetical protein
MKKVWIKASEQACLDFILDLETRVGKYHPPNKYDIPHQTADGRWYVTYIPEIDPYITEAERAQIVELEEPEPPPMP